MRKYICIDIGGTNIKYGVLNEEGNVLFDGSRKTSVYEDGNDILGDIDNIICNLINKYQVEGVGVSTAGVVDDESGTIIHAGKTIPGYIGTDIKGFIEEKFLLKCEVENDVNSAALGEAFLGSGKGYKSIFCMTIGTGIGGAIILNNDIVRGASKSAGEVGYINVNGKPIQEIASTKILVENVAKRKNIKVSDINGRIVFEEGKRGDSICYEEIDKLVDNLTELISSVIYFLNPEVIILGGGIMEQREFLEPKINSSLKAKLPKAFFESTKIEFAKLGNRAGMIGALYNFINKRD
ncbi:ROK family protein [Clostridium sardiniense]|uniref:ROK family protein n=1 Tax=Clostridium sardiniense TaxID=29369 RepID=A0ABS7L2F4_CLOSR|nr:ROK family protein [Clostridium sardiniense]MBY0757261.1 ROK family protein [Clostridium sardiniense]MDQ0461583.1 putative NBD/HSP70 family sugar kinase [Clostridium sardiniense]